MPFLFWGEEQALLIDKPNTSAAATVGTETDKKKQRFRKHINPLIVFLSVNIPLGNSRISKFPNLVF